MKKKIVCLLVTAVMLFPCTVKADNSEKIANLQDKLIELQDKVIENIDNDKMVEALNRQISFIEDQIETLKEKDTKENTLEQEETDQKETDTEEQTKEEIKEEGDYKYEGTNDGIIRFNSYNWDTPYKVIFENEINETMEEGKDYYVEDDYISLFYDNIAGYRMVASYGFTDDKLSNGCYSILDEHTNLTQYYLDFKDLASKFTSLYGDPIDKTELWLDDLYKDDPSDWGMSFALGYSKFMYTWEDKEKNVLYLMITGDNYEVNVTMVYRTQEYDELIDSSSNTNGL